MLLKETFPLDDKLKAKAQVWALAQNYSILFNGQAIESEYPYGGFPERIVVNSGKKAHLHPNSLQKGKEYYGCIAYDFKNRIEDLESSNPQFIDFPDFEFWEADVRIDFLGSSVMISALEPHKIFSEIQKVVIDFKSNTQNSRIRFTPQTPKDEYLNNVSKIINNLKRGDIYEMNYCMTFYAENIMISPLQIYGELTKASPTPFACLAKFNGQFLICASPERYLKISDQKLVSQPIKGTQKVSNQIPIPEQMAQLKESAKERNENVMIVDLVRNDLSKICTAGTVKVEELFGIYQFAQVLQMISTVSGTIPPNTSFEQILQGTFPMGSMSGAPKFKSLELIEKYESFKRNIYSGSIGFIEADGNADFNVVIRSIFYNAQTQCLSFSVGSGITALSNPQSEYDECLLKAEKILQAVNGFLDFQ